MSVSTNADDRLYRTVAQVLGVEAETLSEESSPATIPNWDSLNHLNLVMAIEAEYGVSLSPEEALEMHNIAAIRAILGEPAAPAEGKIAFVDCTIDHLPALKAFAARSYRSDYVLAINDAYIRWQFGGIPAGDGRRLHMKLALAGGEVVGCLGCFPVELSAGGRVMTACWLANWMVDPNQRHLGLGPMLVREVAKDYEISLAVGANHDAQDIFNRMGWTDFGEMPRYVAVLDRQGAAGLTESGQLDWPADARPLGTPTGQADVRPAARFGADVAQLWDRIWGSGPTVAGTRRTAEFLNWRYVDHPQFRYRAFEARRQGMLCGFAVYRVEQARDLPVRVGRLVELVAEPGIEDSLLGAVLEDARAQQAVAVDFFCPATRFGEIMARHGFLPGEHPAAARIPTLYQPIDRRRGSIRFMADLRSIPDAAVLGDWYITKSDGDQDRPN